MSRLFVPCVLLALFVSACKGEKVDSRMLGIGSPPGIKAQVPADVEPSKWQELAEGLGDADEIDLALLSHTVMLDADWNLETQPYLLARVGLWLPILRALPAQVRAEYQELIVDPLESDPGPRTEQLIITFAEGTGARTDVDRVAVFARTRDGLVLDLVRLAAKSKPGEGSQIEATAVLLEPLSSDQRMTIRKLHAATGSPPREYVLSEDVTLMLAEDHSSATLLTPGGIVEVGRKSASASDIVDALYRVVRRASEGRSNGQAVEHRVAKGTFRGLEDGGRLTFELDLDGALSLRGSYASDDVGSIERAEAGLRDPEFLARLRQSARPSIPRTIENLISSSRFVREGSTLRFELRAPVADLIDDLGGVALDMPDRAAAIGAGLSATTIQEATDNPVSRLTPSQLAEQVTAGLSLRFLPPKNARHQAIARWLELEGTLHKFVSASPFGQIPVTLSECGAANAFYLPGRQAIVLCYELAADMVHKLRRAFKSDEDLGRAVIGGMLFILLHEYGHALIDIRHLPAAGMEEDAVDQLAALTLIELGDQGLIWAVTAMHWFRINEQLGESTPHWDEHSSNARRAFNITCLVYGSSPERFAMVAGTETLPRTRANQCPAEFLKAKQAWAHLLSLGPNTAKTPAPSVVSSPAASAPLREASPASAECDDVAGAWEFTTTVTSASKSGVGTRGYYRMTVSPGCELNLEKLGFDAIRFAPDRIQRGHGRLARSGSTFRIEVGLVRGGAVDYTAAFVFDVGQSLDGTWSYTGESFKTTGFSGTLVGRRL